MHVNKIVDYLTQNIFFSRCMIYESHFLKRFVIESLMTNDVASC